ncbi:MAG: type II toxin-antitoxin system Phd/YefM family antitoxin [Deltaproteobacteria bacterium]|nr:type II toxin-antitoxin system Phd/YefM family antitoxin [Deltaproteobacteria bacterium]MBW1950347.1 type II toxin-antitoxin system Phd/YefM family antitoxin [Deltaproteobacteria bacterium]MBW2349007.1 type II toxin-antitoxin system Phd/YefM family antitoxin [Deltaproteobacteria bacterium]
MERLNITEARKRFMRLPEETARQQIIAVTRRNQEVMALMSWDLYEGLLESLEILGDSEIMGDLQKAIADLSSGRTISLKEARSRLGL